MRLSRQILALAPPVAAAALATTAPAHAEYVRATYSGAVDEVSSSTPAGLDVGTPITFSVVYDPSRLVDYTASFNLDNGTSFSQVATVSLSDDPKASLTIKVGPISFTKFDGLQYGTPFGDCDLKDCGPAGLGIGNLPSATYLNGSFAGVGNIFINGEGYSLDADPIADFFSGGFGLDGPGTDTFDFYLGEGDLANPFTTGLAVGNIDMSTLTITPVPEPATWGMMLAGFLLAGSALRLRRSLRPC